MISKGHQDSIFLESARVLTHDALAGDQFSLRLHAPACAEHAMPGQFTHLQCDPSLAMRRPFSIMRTDPVQGTVDVLYKVVGQGTQLLSQREVGSIISVLGPIGCPFSLGPGRRRPLLLGGGVGIPPMIFLAQQLRGRTDCRPMVFMGSEVPFPFSPRPSRFVVPGIPDHVIASMPLMEDWSIPSRLASLQNFPGCYDGFITELAECWLGSLTAEQRREIHIFACGPVTCSRQLQPLLGATTYLATSLSRNIWHAELAVVRAARYLYVRRLPT
jgi:dihydroorotate dehydrogenase electron transfer subunit